ncbi:hypothetical protein [Nannocystis sp. SCPEA4]|uniref:hypothetical protein n=1 Tax=Nannocystis sp. SCPEA4 TaxID=2996787 RepID=UPI00226F8E66|nr:hypothetical protein [Nannocystis sp. SCPEA4]MCY1061619.1 hypothetical protein [Nannocystis sp. SCPEA4]
MNSPALPFPTRPLRPPAELEQHFWRCDDTRCPDASYRFSIVLPRSWAPLDTPVAPPAAGGGLVSLGVYRPGTLVTAEVEVHACLLAREVAPADWLELYLERLGAEVVARRDVDTEGGKVADILTRSASADGPLVTRWLAMKNYDRLFLLEGRALEPNYPSAAEAIFTALTNVNLLHPIDWPLVERLRSFSRRHPGDFLVLYPESWQLVEDPANSERALQVSLLQRAGDVVVGKLVFATVARDALSDPQALADRFAADLRAGDMEVGPLRLVPDAPRPGFAATWQALAPVGLGGIAGESRVWIGERPDAWFFAGVLGPARAADPEAWAVNTRAHAILLQYLKVP